MVKRLRTPRLPNPPRRRNVRPAGAGVAMDWREVEKALVEIARAYKLELREQHSGDIEIDIDAHISVPMGDDAEYTGPPLNLTEIAKELTDRLGRKA